MLLIHQKLNLRWLEICAEERHPGTWERHLGKDGRRTVVLWPHSCFPELHLLPLRAVVIRYQHCCAWQEHLQHRNSGLFYTVYVVSTVFAAFIQTRHYVWLRLFEDSERWETSGK